MNPTTEKVPASPAQQHVQASGDRQGRPHEPGGPNGAGRNRSGAKPGERKSLASRLRRDKQMLVMMLPGVLFLLVFFYVPILGNVIAFQDYQPFSASATASGWVGRTSWICTYQPGLRERLLEYAVSGRWQLVFLFPVPLVLALIVDSLISTTHPPQVFQSLVYLPHFLSWVLVIALFQQMLGGAGLVNNSLRRLGMDTIPFMTNADTFPLLAIVQLVWKDAGWAMIIFLASLAAIDGSLYEAAAADGAGRWRRMWHITLPGLRSVIVLLLILRIGDILSVGFEQFLLQRRRRGRRRSGSPGHVHVLYRVVGGGWSSGAAAGLAKGVVGALLIFAANKVAHDWANPEFLQKKVG